MEVIPLNGLSQLSAPRSTYAVVGAGKTGIDACLWLLKQKVNPDRIYWIMPRDSWFVCREAFDPYDFDMKKRQVTTLLDSIETDSTVYEHSCSLEKTGFLARLDPKIEPLKNKCATVSRPELDALRQIKHVVRLGHVTCLGKGFMLLENGKVMMPKDTLYVDCSTNGLARRPVTPVFTSSKRITLQSVSMCQQVFSAAMVAFVEATGVANKWTDDKKNSFCTPVPHPETPEDFVRFWVQTVRNKVRAVTKR